MALAALHVLLWCNVTPRTLTCLHVLLQCDGEVAVSRERVADLRLRDLHLVRRALDRSLLDGDGRVNLTLQSKDQGGAMGCKRRARWWLEK